MSSAREMAREKIRASLTLNGSDDASLQSDCSDNGSLPTVGSDAPAGAVTKRVEFTRLAGGGYSYALPDDGVRVELRYLHRDHGSVSAEVDVRCNWAAALTYDGSLSCSVLNLSSQTTRKGLGKHCTERSKVGAADFDWIGVIDAACLMALRAEREGDAAIVLDDAPEITERDIDVYGLLLPTDAASLLIAHGDSLKSMTALLIAGTLVQRGMRVLYLDWEWSADRHRGRKVKLFGAERLDGLRYLRCRAPLVHEADRLRRYCEAEQIDYTIVDSVGLAADGKLADDDTAIRFYRALGTLPPALCCAHVPKTAAADPKADAIGPFGSVFWHNMARASWLVKKTAGPSDNVAIVGLIPQKQNDGSRHQPVGLEFTFGERFAVRPVNLAGVEALADRVPVHQRMRHVLARGPMTYAAIAAELGAKVDTVQKAASRKGFLKLVNSADGIHRIALAEERYQ